MKGVDERRLVGAQLQKLAEGEAGAASYFVLSGIYSFWALYLVDFVKTFSINCGELRDVNPVSRISVIAIFC